MIITVVAALAAAFCNGANVITQHSASFGAPKRAKGLHLVRYLFRQPLWLLGWVAAVGGFVFQAVARPLTQIETSWNATPTGSRPT